MLIFLDEFEYHEESEAEKSINAWRQSQGKIMIDIVEDLIETSHKYAKSQYIPGGQPARWTKLAGQLIWYKDQILKNFSLEAMSIELNDLKSEKRRERESQTRNLPLISFRKPEDKKLDKPVEAESSEPAKDSDPEGA